MSDNVVKLKTNSLSNPTKIKINDFRDAPILETTIAENLIIKKFLVFAINDIKYQMDMIAKSGISQEKINENLLASALILEYQSILLKEIERGIKSAKPKRDK